MKKLLALVLLMYLISIFNVIKAQVQEIKIDPRQYVTVTYKNYSSKLGYDTIWNWEKRRSVPNQKLYYLNLDGEIKIDFDRSSIIQNANFEGTVSLEAEISGPNGTRKIEVNPYSEIGIQRMPIGIKSEPPSELAKKLLNMILELKDVDSLIQKIPVYSVFSTNPSIKNQDIINRYKKIDSMFSLNIGDLSVFKTMAVEFERKIYETLYSSYYYYRIKKFDFSKAKKTEEVKQFVDSIFTSYSSDYVFFQDQYVESYSRALKYSKEKLNIIDNYLKSFDNSGDDAVKAFLSLINKDYINYDALKGKILSLKERLDKIKLSETNIDSTILVLNRSSTDIKESLEALSVFSKFRGSKLEEILKDTISALQGITKVIVNKSQNEKDQEYYSLLESNIESISRQLSVFAGRIIFRKLVYASIDLGKSGVKQNEVLNLYITWILDSKRDSLGNSPRLPIGKYYLRETGIVLAISDMFSMVKRINEAKVNPATVSPTNFKGAGGAVLMWTYYKVDKGMRIRPKGPDDYTVNRKARFINFLEPSMGLNVSYLDFSTDKDVEVGVGLQVGFFRNKVYFGYGLNLHLMSPTNQAPTYFYIGFSFAKLSELFKTSNVVSSLQ